MPEPGVIEKAKETGNRFLTIAPGFTMGATAVLAGQYALWWFFTNLPSVVTP